MSGSFAVSPARNPFRVADCAAKGPGLAALPSEADRAENANVTDIGLLVVGAEPYAYAAAAFAQYCAIGVFRPH